MKIPHSQFGEYMKMISKIEFDIGSESTLFFPMEVDDSSKTTEYGTMLLENKQSQNDLSYGFMDSTLVTGIALRPDIKTIKKDDGTYESKIDKMIGYLAYCRKSDLLVFNINEYMTLIKQENISDEEKSKLAALECFVSDLDKMRICRLELE